MFKKSSALSFVLASLSAVYSQSVPDNLDAATIQTLGNNSLFERWRPYSHFLAPAGWMNDPCGMMYDPGQAIYHLMYQWHPYHVNWGNISWGHATSRDLVTWTDVGGWDGNDAEAIVTGPIGSYNGLGIFSGTAQPVNIHGVQDGTLTAFYTSVSYLPTNWQIYYHPGTETQSLVTSIDGGRTWEQYSGNPIISGPPEGWNITGWRDPMYHTWPEMDALLGQDPHYYAVFGSGIKGVGPRIPFYSAPASDLTSWTFLGALWEPADNTTLGTLLETGTYGFNFEVSNFFSLKDEDGEDHFYVMMGTEGGNLTWHPRAQWGLWNEGIVTRRENGSVAFEPVAGGAIDSGLLYAVTSFNDMKNNRRVQWGWATEDMNNFAINQQGFQGAFAIPREMYAKKTTGLVSAEEDPSTPGNNRIVDNGDGTITAHTLGARPVPEVVDALRVGATYSHPTTSSSYSSSAAIGKGSSSMEILATFKNFTGRAGLAIAVGAGDEEYTLIYFEPSNYTINVDRSHSSTIVEFSNYTMLGYYYPYVYAGKDGADDYTEDVTMHIYLDGSLLEVLVNERFWLTTRIYPSRLDSTGVGIYVADGASVEVSDFEMWTGLTNIFPDRPLNSSSKLVFDTAAETNNYTWWAGN